MVLAFGKRSPWFESRPNLIFLPCIYSFVSLLRTLFVRLRNPRRLTWVDIFRRCMKPPFNRARLISMGESNTVVSAYRTLYRHPQQYFSQYMGDDFALRIQCICNVEAHILYISWNGDKIKLVGH